MKPATLAKWMLFAMQGADIDIASFKAHSVRSASSSDMVTRGLSLPQILGRADWSQSSKTFETFYKRS